MKPLSKLHQEAVLKAKTEEERVKAAANAMIETPMEMIRAILMKHETAVIEVMRELHESREAAVTAEREACAKVCDDQANQDGFEGCYANACAEAIRARSQA
jgi:hypothetical protein